MALLFWICAGLLLFVIAGYHVLAFALARLFPRPVKKQPGYLPAVTAVIAARNEESRIAGRLRNLLASDYPADSLEIVVVSDGSTDRTVEEVQSVRDARVRLIAQPVPAGKAACLNAGLAAATGDIIVFADARQCFEPGAVRALAANFADPRIGAVSGELAIQPSQSVIGGGVDIYWRMEKALRQLEAATDSSIGCTGAIYAIRRNLFSPLPTDTILDDVVIPMRIVEQSYRVVFERGAVAFDPQPLDPANEHRRKVRTLAGNLQMLLRQPHWLLPWKNRLWWRLIAHKYLRLAMPVLLVLMLLANLVLASRPLYLALLIPHLGFYVCGLFGLMLPHLRLRLFSLPAAFLFLNGIILLALTRFFTAKNELWLPSRPAQDTGGFSPSRSK